MNAARRREGALSAVVFWGVVFGAVAYAMLGRFVPQFRRDHGLPVLDTETFHSASRSLELMAGYSPGAKRDYLVFLTLDCVFPVTASLFVISMLHALFARLGIEGLRARILLLIPALAAVADLVENAFHALLTLLYPLAGTVLAYVAFGFTSAKVILVFATYAVLSAALAGLLARLVAQIRASGS